MALGHRANPLLPQQHWLEAVMGAVSAQEDAPIEVQHDWLSLAIEEIGNEPITPERPALPATPVPKTNGQGQPGHRLTAARQA